MLNDKGFDRWADGYDDSVVSCALADKYPFAGYGEVLGGVYEAVRSREKARVLDVGFGTGTLTRRLYDDGYDIFGVDFSELMAHLKKDGAILMGGVAFETRAELEACRAESGGDWDTDEAYIVFDEVKKSFPTKNVGFKKISRCAGTAAITR